MQQRNKKLQQANAKCGRSFQKNVKKFMIAVMHEYCNAPRARMQQRKKHNNNSMQQ